MPHTLLRATVEVNPPIQPFNPHLLPLTAQFALQRAACSDSYPISTLTSLHFPRWCSRSILCVARSGMSSRSRSCHLSGVRSPPAQFTPYYATVLGCSIWIHLRVQKYSYGVLYTSYAVGVKNGEWRTAGRISCQ